MYISNVSTHILNDLLQAPLNGGAVHVMLNDFGYTVCDTEYGSEQLLIVIFSPKKRQRICTDGITSS